MRPPPGPPMPERRGWRAQPWERWVSQTKQPIFHVWRGRFSKGVEQMQDEPSEWEFLCSPPVTPPHAHSPATFIAARDRSKTEQHQTGKKDHNPTQTNKGAGWPVGFSLKEIKSCPDQSNLKKCSFPHVCLNVFHLSAFCLSSTIWFFFFFWILIPGGCVHLAFIYGLIVYPVHFLAVIYCYLKNKVPINTTSLWEKE